MDATCVAESPDHAPILCGCARAYALTGAATRRSELPSRSTGFTAEPSTLAYRALVSFSASDNASPLGKGGTSKPLALSSAMTASSCGTDAETLGSLTMFARGVFAISPSAARTSGRLCEGASLSGNAASTRLAREMSAASTATPLGARNRRTIGRNARVASAGASSVSVYQILADFFTPVASGVGASVGASSIARWSTSEAGSGCERRNAAGRSRGDGSGGGARVRRRREGGGEGRGALLNPS